MNWTGLGEYLKSIDPQQRDWLWQIEHCIVYCTVHFNRGIDLAAGASGNMDSLRGQMLQLLDCQSRADYLQLVHLLIGKSIL
jgi:hypothetical protein